MDQITYTQEEVKQLCNDIANKFNRLEYKIQTRYLREIKKLEKEIKRLKGR